MDLDTPGTPQNLALDWITNLDTLYVCPQQTRALIQRYVMAVFYYSTRGDSWRLCSAPEDFSDPDSIDMANALCGDNAWLTPVSECLWRFLECEVNPINVQNEVMVRIDIGKKRYSLFSNEHLFVMISPVPIRIQNKTE